MARLFPTRVSNGKKNKSEESAYPQSDGRHDSRAHFEVRWDSRRSPARGLPLVETLVLLPVLFGHVQMNICIGDGRRAQPVLPYYSTIPVFTSVLILPLLLLLTDFWLGKTVLRNGMYSRRSHDTRGTR